MTDLLVVSAAVASVAQLFRLVRFALGLRFLERQLEHVDASGRLDVSLAIARNMGSAEPSDAPVAHVRSHRPATPSNLFVKTQAELPRKP